MMGYHHYWFPAQKKGYSGVGLITKQDPDNVVKTEQPIITK